MRIVGIAGSLRSGSFNRHLLEAAAELTPPGVDLDILSLEGLPLFNSDMEAELLISDPLSGFRATVEAADAVLIATPEYNASIPGVLANALDWASRPVRRAPLTGKPVGIVSASPGAMGGGRAQEHLKLSLMTILCHVLPHPGFIVPQAGSKFENGRLTDERTRERLQRYVADLVAWTEQLSMLPVTA